MKTTYKVDTTGRITLPEAQPGEVYDVEMRAPGYYVVKRAGAVKPSSPAHKVCKYCSNACPIADSSCWACGGIFD